MSFSDEIRRFSKFAKAVPVDTRRGACIALFSSVIHDSPVGNPELWKSQQHKPIKDRKGPPGYTGGRFRANWICTLNQPSIGTLDVTKFDNIAAMEDTVRQMQGDQEIFLVNNLPYAQPLEDGHSKQAPHGMVKRNVARIQQIILESLRDARNKNQ